MASPTKRTYDARRRQQRAEEERRATRRRVVDAARGLFVAKGYVATTMSDIAQEAGVALQSVYKAGNSKAELLHMAIDLDVAGDDREVMYTDRAMFRAIGDEPDPHRQVRMIADLIAATQERSAPIQAAYRQAAAVDVTVAADLDAAHQRRLETFAVALDMIAEHHLRRPPEESTVTTWAVGSSDVFLLLRTVRGWDAEQYRAWLRQTLTDVLLRPDH